MEFEVLKKSHNKEIIIGISVFVVIAIALIVKGAFAKYELVKSIKIAEGTISYKVPDFKIMAMYKNDGNGDIEIDTMPETGYIINESKTYCEVNGAKDINAGIYTDDVGQHIITNITKGSRCYLYFVKSAASQILGNITEIDFERIYKKNLEMREDFEKQIEQLKNVDTEEKQVDLKKIVKEFVKLKNIDRTTLVQLVDRIEISQDKEITIYYKFRELNVKSVDNLENEKVV